MYSRKSQSELIENKDYNMELLLPHNTAKIKYFSKIFSIRIFIGYQRALGTFQVAANGGGMECWGVRERFPINR